MVFDSIQALTLGETLYASRKRLPPEKLLFCSNLDGTTKDLSRYGGSCSFSNGTYKDAGYVAATDAGASYAKMAYGNPLTLNVHLGKSLNMQQSWSVEIRINNALMIGENISGGNIFGITAGEFSYTSRRGFPGDFGIQRNGSYLVYGGVVGAGMGHVAMVYDHTTGKIYGYTQGNMSCRVAVDVSGALAVSSLSAFVHLGSCFGQIRVIQGLINAGSLTTSYPVPTELWTGYEAI